MSDNKYIYAALFGVLAIIVLFFTSITIIPPVEPPSYGTQVQTVVTVSNWWWTVSISNIESSIVTQPPVTKEPTTEISVFPWKGKLVLTVVYPNGWRQNFEKSISVDFNTDRDYIFYWSTTQIGKHNIIVSLYDSEGNLVDQKTSYIEVWG